MDVIGGGVLMAAAAVLWVAYLLPSWLRRRQYLATERNAVRLGQTIRIIAETSETPEPVRLEVSAREVATQQRILAEHEATARAEAEAAEQLAIAERVAAEQAARDARELALRALATAPIDVVRAESQSDVAQSDVATAAAPAPDLAAQRRRLRRRRGRRSLLLLASLLALVVGLVGLPFGLPSAVAIVAAVGVVVALAELARLARAGRAIVPVAVAPAEPVVAEPFEPIELPAEEVHEPGWTPQPLPRPLTLSRGTIAAAAMASIEAAEQLRRAGVEAELAERAAEIAPQPPRLPSRPAEPAAEAEPTSGSVSAVAEPASPYARMGIVGETTPGIDDLDAVLRRRRRAV
ncbi:hypothetical protein [Agromyces larvae]|uniref:Large exoprotein n=1 Tax=Agromyces larvae TaxID=2929802 RepID=A0ABY4C367_9MICO|nr:hypothetical protein [Agromyces larvae]UOE45840.1 hypothetical protein MTO99_08890 [Agromyces larvae]